MAAKKASQKQEEAGEAAAAAAEQKKREKKKKKREKKEEEEEMRKNAFWSSPGSCLKEMLSPMASRTAPRRSDRPTGSNAITVITALRR
jgi:hypothetical protein